MAHDESFLKLLTMTKEMKFLNAAKYGDIEKIKIFLNPPNNISANYKDIDGWTALHIATMRGHFNIIKLLVDRGADVNAVTVDGENSLKLAICGYRSAEVVDYLLEKGAIADSEFIKMIRETYSTSKGNTALHNAVQKGCVSLVHCLLVNGDDIHAKNDVNKSPFDLANNNMKVSNLIKLAQETAVKLFKAGQSGDLQQVKNILAKDYSNINFKDARSGLPLIDFIIAAKRKEVVRFFLENKDLVVNENTKKLIRENIEPLDAMDCGGINSLCWMSAKYISRAKIDITNAKIPSTVKEAIEKSKIYVSLDIK